MDGELMDRRSSRVMPQDHVGSSSPIQFKRWSSQSLHSSDSALLSLHLSLSFVLSHLSLQGSPKDTFSETIGSENG